MHTVEPYYGWLKFYQNETDEYSPFHDVEHNEFFYDRQVYQYLAHPQWDSIESESLLVKILYANYEHGYAIIEFLGVWNDRSTTSFDLIDSLFCNQSSKSIVSC